MAKKKEWKEAELVLAFRLERITTYQTPLMVEWLAAKTPQLTESEQLMFDKIQQKAAEKIAGWSEEDLKMKFLSFVLELGHLSDEGNIVTFFDKKLTGTVEGIPLSVKSDFMLAKGFMNIFQTPYFHFQEYKPQINPKGEPMAQLLEAFLIAQAKNQGDGHDIPLYGCEIIGGTWRFITMQGKQYCISNFYDCTNREDLLQIVAILRKFKQMLLERWLN